MKKTILKRLTCLCLSLAMLLTLSPVSVMAEAEGESEAFEIRSMELGEFAQQFANPDGLAKPYIRWWVTPGLMTEEETRREVRMMADAGFGGIELVALVAMASIGSDTWNRTMAWALEEAIDCGIQLDFTIGEGWPIATPAISDPDDIRSEQGLFYHTVDFSYASGAGYTETAIPLPSGQFASNRPYELVAVTAAKKDGSGGYDSDTAVAITDKLIGTIDMTDAGGMGIDWTPGEAGDWTVFYLYRQGISASGLLASAPTVDHFSKDATEAVLRYWDESVMAGDLMELYETNAGSIFCDSLEIGQANKNQSAFWTANLLEEFERRRDYDLTPYLPAIFISGYYPYYSHSKETDAAPDFEFTGGFQIREDFFKTLTELFTENHVEAIRDWAHGHKMTLRYQVYGAPMELTEPTLAVDIVETESWGHSDNLDMYRTQSGAVHMTGSGLYSTESAAVISLAWAQTWTGSHNSARELTNGLYWPDNGSNNVYRSGGNEDAGMLYHWNRQLAAGVNRIVMHGFSYKSSMMYSWPGDSFMSIGGFPNEWDDKTPMWEHIEQMTGYLSRTQLVMQKGQADIDLLVYRKYNYEGNQAFDWSLNKLERNGFTYDFGAPALFELDNAVVSEQDGMMVLAADGPSYKAIVLDQRKFTGTGGGLIASSMPLETAETILGYAKQGLPVVIVSDAPSSVGSFGGSAAKMASDDAELARIMTELAELDNVVSVDAKSNVPSALKTLDVSPDVSKDTSSAILGFHRTDADAEYYYLYNTDLNRSTANTVTLKGSGTPYLLDPWSGEITPIAQYRKGNDGITLTVELEPNDVMFIALAEDSWSGGTAPSQYVSQSDADAAVYDENGGLAIRTTQSGIYSVTVGEGESGAVNVVLDADAPITLDDWTMVLQTWSQGASALETSKEDQPAIPLNTLVPWNEISGFEQAAGVATYTTEFNLDKGWSEGQGAYINFERVSDTMQLFVNGVEVPVNQIANTVDIGPMLRSDEPNEIVAKVTSNLANVKSSRTQEFGIVGDVVVTPYIQTPVKLDDGEAPSVWPDNLVIAKGGERDFYIDMGSADYVSIESSKTNIAEVSPGSRISSGDVTVYGKEIGDAEIEVVWYKLPAGVDSLDALALAAAGDIKAQFDPAEASDPPASENIEDIPEVDENPDTQDLQTGENSEDEETENPESPDIGAGTDQDNADQDTANHDPDGGGDTIVYYNMIPNQTGAADDTNADTDDTRDTMSADGTQEQEHDASGRESAFAAAGNDTGAVAYAVDVSQLIKLDEAIVTVKVVEPDAIKEVSVIFIDRDEEYDRVDGVVMGESVGPHRWPENPVRSGYTFTGWYSGNGTRYTASTRLTESYDIVLYAGWQAASTPSGGGSHGGGGNGGSNMRESTTSSWTTSSITAVSEVTQAAALAAVDSAVAAAQTNGAPRAIVNLKNPGQIAQAVMQSMVKRAGDVPLIIHADTLAGSAVDVRLYIDPALAIGDVNLSASTGNERAKSLKALFENWFANKLVVVSVEHDGAFGQSVEVAAKLTGDLAASGELVLYSYNSGSNTYSKLADQNYRIDGNGYIHFNILNGGAYVISDGALTK